MERGVPLIGRLAVTILLLAAGTCGAAQRPVPPRITKLKELFLETDVVKDAQPRATIVVPASGRYDALAQRIAQATKALTGVALPIVTESSPAAALPLRGNVIALGNRSTNPFIGELYSRYYSLLDLRYPGAGGHVVRTLHNPFGNGFNVVFAGGSDTGGVEAAANVLIQELKQAKKGKSIRLGRLAEIRLGKNIRVPKHIKEVKIWEASAGYRSVGYFGWNSISKRMALYYMTGEPFHAREFLRLAFPDARARREISEVDGERIEDKHHPLSGPYHYNAHLMILLWDLIEESPVFTDEDRLRVTDAFSQQLNHWASEWAFAGRSRRPPRAVGSRHGQWAAISLYCLGRYFQTYYPAPLWERCLEAGVRHFSPLHRHAWVSGENDNLFWYNTAIAPILTYMVLTGDRVPLENGVLARLLRGQEILASGRSPDWALRSASLGFLHKAAYLTQDGRWLTYRERTGVDTTVFRVGQSFWPAEHLEPRPPDDLAGKWTIHRLPKPKWEARRSGLPHGESFEFASFRSRPDAGGDFMLIDGFNGASRNPYHTFAILELRLGGYTLLRRYLNQLVTRVDGLMEPKIAMNAALKHCDVVGETAIAVAEVPNAAFARWRRTLVQRVGRYALIVDELTFRKDSPNAEVRLEWETERGARRLGDGRIAFPAAKEHGGRRVDKWGQICTADPMRTTGRGRRWTMQWLGPVRKGERKIFFSLVGMQPGAKTPTLECHRAEENSAMLAVPEPVEVAVRRGPNAAAELAVLASDHLFARAATRIVPQITASAPVDLDWDLAKGTMHLVASAKAQLGLALEPTARPTLDGNTLPIKISKGPEDVPLLHVEVAAGRHVIEGAVPASRLATALPHKLKKSLEIARAERAEAMAERRGKAEAPVPALRGRFNVSFGSAIVDIDIVGLHGGPLLAVAQGKTVHFLTLDGRETKALKLDGAIRMLRWWPRRGLLLVGCADERVVAFDNSGRQRWVFVSEMDPAVFRAAKTYWFKTAPGHEGIHGLYSGVFLGGESQAFVGSACTLEILDERGQLIRRMPQFWGKVSTFVIVDGPKGTRNLLAARKYNGVNNVAIINSKTLDPRPRGFIAVPPGHTYMPGWSSMNRHHLFYEDLDGDGTREIISEINGTWNRVCAWTVDGKPKHAANFGPGARIPARTMRDIDVCDLDGDGKKEIVVATSYEMVLALDAKCNKLWATRLTSAANVMACVRPKGQKQAWVVLGCDDGHVRVLDAKGKLVRKSRVAGRPVAIHRLADAGGNQFVAIGTTTGQVSTFIVAP